MEMVLGWEGVGRVDPALPGAPQARGPCPHHRWELRLPPAMARACSPSGCCCFACLRVVLQEPRPVSSPVGSVRARVPPTWPWPGVLVPGGPAPSPL